MDDQKTNLLLLARLLERGGYHQISTLADSRAVIPVVRDFLPDIILLDLHMPGMDGFAVLELLAAEISPEDFLPIIVLSADAAAESRKRALSLGAKDFLNKPFDEIEVRLRVRNLLDARAMYQSLQSQNRNLEVQVRHRTLELENSRFEVLDRLGRAAEYRDDVTGGHIRRVATHAARLATALGLPSASVEQIRRTSALHDVGKIGIPDAILRKQGLLTLEEQRVMRTHTEIGQQLLEGAESDLCRLAEQIAYAHHERWDGRGYPRGLVAGEIPLAARIVALADVYDALIQERPYKPSWPAEQARAEVAKGRGTHFDPELTDLFLQLL